VRMALFACSRRCSEYSIKFMINSEVTKDLGVTSLYCEGNVCFDSEGVGCVSRAGAVHYFELLIYRMFSRSAEKVPKVLAAPVLKSTDSSKQ
jgi:hypothetical protein